MTELPASRLRVPEHSYTVMYTKYTPKSFRRLRPPSSRGGRRDRCGPGRGCYHRGARPQQIEP